MLCRIHEKSLFLLIVLHLILYSCEVSLSDKNPNPFILGYFTGNEESYASLQAYSGGLDMLSIDVFNVQDDGTIVQYDDLGAADYANEHGIPAYACVSNYRGEPLYDFDPTLARAAILTHRDTFLSQLVEIAQDERYTGINIDLESIAYSDDIETDRAAFTSFIQELAARLRAMGKQLIISVPAKSAESPDDDWAYPYDLAALGQAADYLQLMTYDQHGPWSEPGPVASLDWVEAGTAYVAELVDPAKLLLGLPAYAYDWDLGAYEAGEEDAVADLYWTDIPKLLALPGAQVGRDTAADSPFLRYSLEGDEHIVWYEDTASIRAKASLVGRYNLGGIAVWALGQEDAGFWQAALEPLQAPLD
ncbi:spore germination protein YaaH [Pelolinea submarina]|uniref:Spore germination protein YaaH n=1 Tax=Pelolinea submarina TaxID=913107 RepID=A0A3E0A314_9CHLR|nr:spore germination protein YaaH [Pelolinea submarina]